MDGVSKIEGDKDLEQITQGPYSAGVGVPNWNPSVLESSNEATGWLVFRGRKHYNIERLVLDVIGFSAGIRHAKRVASGSKRSFC